MKTKVFKFSGHMIAVAFACVSVFPLFSCSSGSDDDESSSAVQLSEETTPIDFQFTDKLNKEYCLFDYAGNSYIGSDTIVKKQGTVNLRQGKHRILFFHGLMAGRNLSYDPVKKTANLDDNGYIPEEGLAYAEKEMEITPYLMPVQQITCKTQLACAFSLEVTDLDYAIKNLRIFEKSLVISGKTKGLPYVKRISLDGNDYELSSKTNELDTYIVDEDGIAFKPVNVGYYHEYGKHRMLCPPDGINDIQATVSMTDEDGKTIASVTLPRFSLRRAQTTILRGPLFSGTTADWQIVMEPYK